MMLRAIIERSHREPERWRYTKVADLLSKIGGGLVDKSTPAAVVAVDPHLPRLYFEDHRLIPHLSNTLDLPHGMITEQSEGHYLLNLEGQTCLATMPLELTVVHTGTSSSETKLSLSIALKASDRLSLIERHRHAPSCAKNHPLIMTTSIHLGAQAKLTHARLITDSATQFNTTTINLAASAFYNHMTLVRGGACQRHEVTINHNGEQSQSSLRGILLLTDRNHIDFVTQMNHVAEGASSHQYIKAVSAGRSEGSFQGTIQVAKGASKTSAEQLCRSILLSDQTTFNMKPELEIYHDDVTCSHGSSSGKLDDDALFYLRARGLNPHEARSLMIKGFVSELIEGIQVKEWHNHFYNEVEAWLDEQSKSDH